MVVCFNEVGLCLGKAEQGGEETMKKHEKSIVVPLGEVPTVTEVTERAFEADAFREQDGEFSYRVQFGKTPPSWYSEDSLEGALAEHNARCCARR